MITRPYMPATPPRTSLVATAALLIISCLHWTGCDENPPFPLNTTTDTAVDTTYLVGTPEIPQLRGVLIEDFTGVQCVNCPRGHEVVKDYETQYPDRVIGVSIHAGDLSDPLPNSDSTFVLPEGAALYNLLGVIALPAAAINRVHFAGQSFIPVVASANWPAKIDEQLTHTQAPVNIHLDHSYDPATRQMPVAVTLHYPQTVDAAIEHRLHLYITESGIDDPQETTENNETFTIEDYTHNNVLRQMVTFVDGAVVSVPDKNAGRTYVKTFDLTLPSNFDPAKCHLIAFVQQKTTDSQEVLQVIHSPVQ